MRRFVLAIALLAGCGDDDGGGGPLTANGLPGAYINTICNTLVRCGIVSDVATCRGLDFEEEIDPELLVAVENGTVLFDESEARLCLASLAGATCTQDALEADSGHCDLVFSGTVAAGGACAINAQCISQQCSMTSCPVEGCCIGTCVGDTAPLPTLIGDSCANEGCDEGFCDQTTLICTARQPAGASCTDDNQCISDNCGLVCTDLPGLGEPCMLGSGGAQCNSIGLYCGASSTCEAFALEGEACGQTVACSPFYQCVAGSCTLLPTLGDTCTLDSRGCIDNSWCDPATLRCAAPQADGATCQDNDECAGRCDFDTMTCITDPICV